MIEKVGPYVITFHPISACSSKNSILEALEPEWQENDARHTSRRLGLSTGVLDLPDRDTHSSETGRLHDLPLGTGQADACPC
jgi:hypothetical protein